MPCYINEMSELPSEETDKLSKEQSNELDKRFAKVEAGNYVSYSLDEVKHKLKER